MDDREAPQFGPDSAFPRLVHWQVAIGYVVLIVLMAISLTVTYRLAQEQSLSECHASNETRTVLDQVLLVLRAPRDTDEPGDHERRVEIYEQLEPLIELRDCEEKYGR